MQKFVSALRQAWAPAWKTTVWLLKMMIPISFATTLLQAYGVIDWMAQWLNPVFVGIGLPGSSAIAFLTGAFVNTYAGIAVMLTISLTVREATIIAVMTCLCHALFLEGAVFSKTGSSILKITVLRCVMAFVAAFCLNLLLPEMHEPFMSSASASTEESLLQVMTAWGVQTLRMSAMILLLIYALMAVQRLMENYGMLDSVSRLLTPLMVFFGLPRNAAYMWVAGNVLGVSYGSAVMIDLEERGLISRDEANTVNYHLSMNHSMLEDTCVFASFGISAFWILATRITFAFFVVWARKASMRLKAMLH